MSLSANTAIGVGILAFFFDCLVLGFTLWLLRVGTWYRGLRTDEVIRYRRFVGFLKAGWNLGGVVMVTDQRLILRLFWSRLVLAEIPLTNVREIATGRWWWFKTAMITYLQSGEHRHIHVGSSREERLQLRDALASVGLRVDNLQ